MTPPETDSNDPSKRQTTDPAWELRCRYVVVFAWILGITVMERFSSIGTTCLLALTALAIPGVSWKRLLRRLGYVLPFLALSFVTLLFSDGWPISQDAAAFSGLIVFRIVACVLVAQLVAFDPVRAHLNCLRALRCPDVLAATFFLTGRYLDVIGRQWTATRGALVSRLFSPRLRTKSFEVYGHVIGGLTIKALDRSEQIRKAMESRGFHGKIPAQTPARAHRDDLLKSVLALSPLALILLAERLF